MTFAVVSLTTAKVIWKHRIPHTHTHTYIYIYIYMISAVILFLEGFRVDLFLTLQKLGHWPRLGVHSIVSMAPQRLAGAPCSPVGDEFSSYFHIFHNFVVFLFWKNISKPHGFLIRRLWTGFIWFQTVSTKNYILNTPKWKDTSNLYDMLMRIWSQQMIYFLIRFAIDWSDSPTWALGWARAP